MKKRLLSVLIIASGLFVISCGKYEEGPSLSFRSKTARVANTWKIEKVIKNGADATASYADFIANFTMEFSRDGKYSETTKLTNGTKTVSDGEWKFSEDDKQLINTIYGQEIIVFNIIKLKNSEFWYSVYNGANKTEIHLIEAE